jgi:hypothetical protein
MHPRTPSEPDHGPALGWITIAEMFMVIAIIASVSLAVTQPMKAGESNSLALLESDLVQKKKELAKLRREVVERDDLVRLMKGKLVVMEQELAKANTRAAEDRGAADRADARAASSQRAAAAAVDGLKKLQNAFAKRVGGVTLEGKRVVFLVDVSGSMTELAPGIPNRDKWPLVCDHVGEVMASIAAPYQYQVITFSDAVAYPLGNKGKWLDYTKEGQARDAAARLKKIIPKGETDLGKALQEAFTYRDRKEKLEAIYVFSDGLPTGEALPKEERAPAAVAELFAALPALPAANPWGTAWLAHRADAAARASEDHESNQERSKRVCAEVRTAVERWNAPDDQRKRVRIESIGFFYQTPELGSFLWTLARDNGGHFVGMSKP